MLQGKLFTKEDPDEPEERLKMVNLLLNAGSFSYGSPDSGVF